MRKLFLIIALSFFCFNSYATDQNVEYVLNRVFDSSTDSLKATVSGAVEDPVLRDVTVVPEGLTGAPTVAPREIGFTEIQRMSKGFMNELPLEEFKQKYVIETITGGVGVSGVTYVEEVGLLFLIDNNSVNVSIYKLENGMSTEFGNITFSGFTDPEDMDLVEIKRDANGYPDKALFIITEEQTNQFTLFEWDLQSTSGTITKGTNTTTYDPTGMYAESATLGSEGVLWNPIKQVVFTCNQGNTDTFECREFRIDAGLTPAATEPFDAETLWGASIPCINGMRWDPSTNSYLILSDATSDATANSDVLRVHPDTGAILDTWNNFPADLNLVLADHSQWEGIDITEDGRYLIIAGEATEILILERAQNHHVMTFLPADFVLDDTVPPAGPTTTESTGTGTPRRQTLDFDATADEAGFISFTVPQGYNGVQPIQFEFYWYANSITASADCIWAVQISATTEGDADSMLEDAANAEAAAATVAENVNTTEANRLMRTTLKMSASMDSLIAGDFVTVRIYRDADDSVGNADNDGLAVDAQLVAVRVMIPLV